MTTSSSQILEGCIIVGPLFNEPMRVETVCASEDGAWTVGLVGTQSERFRKVTLSARDLQALTILDAGFTYDGDGRLLRLGLQAYSLGIAWEFDPYFGLSISRVDPLPHQLEAIYDYLLMLARVRFLLADDAGAGKTIMAGLLIRELQLRADEEIGKANQDKENGVAEDRRDCYWLYVVTNCRPAGSPDTAQAASARPTLQEPVKDPASFPWHEATKVAHYWLEVDAMTRPMMVREDEPPYRTRGS
jgi:hypothetical protein